MSFAFPLENISSTFNTVSGGNIDTAAQHYNNDNVEIDINDVVIVDDNDDDELPPLIQLYENENGSTYLPEAALPIMDDDWKKRNDPLGRGERVEYRRRIREVRDSPNTVISVIMDVSSQDHDMIIPRGGISDIVGTATSRAVPSGHTQDQIDRMFISFYRR